MLGFETSTPTLQAEPRKRPRQARSRALVERVLDEAADLFERVGYHATTTNHVAEAAGVSVGSLYQYFPNKDALLVGLVERHLDEVTPAIEALAAQLRRSEPDVATFARTVVQAVTELNRSDRLHHLMWSAPRTVALQERLTSLKHVMVTELSWHLLRFGHPADVVEVRARLLSTAIDAAVHDVVTDLERTDRRRELERLVALFLATP